MSQIIEIADAVVAELQGAMFSQPVQVARAYIPRFDLKDLEGVHLTVVPKGIEVSVGTRDESVHEYAIDIGVQKRLPVDDVLAVDALMDLAEEIADFLRFRSLAAMPALSWVGLENGAIYASAHLEQMSLFTSVITVSYQLLR